MFDDSLHNRVILCCDDPVAQDLLWEYACRCRIKGETEFPDRLQDELRHRGFQPPNDTEVVAQRIATDAARTAVDVSRSAVKTGRALLDRLRGQLRG